MGNGYSHNYGYNPFMPYGPYHGGYTPHAQFYGPDPQLVHCPKCDQNTTTKLKFVYGGWTWFYVVFFIVFGIVLFSCVPVTIFCNCLKNAEHRCGRCDTFIGKYERFSGRPVVVLPPECHKHQIMPNYHK
ncbi:unnamed protein product [Meloidogyne enterolobii]|uniref:Uncharacterized protein n=1 Tax=Meloidogyne enterolobii TaxID=390850 RepID=A0ACB1AEH5_MELEN